MQHPYVWPDCPSLCLPLLQPLQAAQLDGKLCLPKLGLAQLSVLQGQPQNAASLLESVLVDAPQWIDALEVRRGAGCRLPPLLPGCRHSLCTPNFASLTCTARLPFHSLNP